MKRSSLLATALLLLFAAVAAPSPDGRRTAAAPQPAWSEVAWPFPMDQWGKGKAFQCKAADCGTEVTVYLRAKIGFCNCTTGVSDDDELARIGDQDLFDGPATALAPGRPIMVAWMKGRSRALSLNSPKQRTAWSALSIGFNDRCDAIVATAVMAHGEPARFEPAVLEFLNSPRVLRWAELTLGL